MKTMVNLQARLLQTIIAGVAMALIFMIIKQLVAIVGRQMCAYLSL